MRVITKSLALAALIGLLLMLPFAVMELTFSAARVEVSNFVALFGFLWLLLATSAALIISFIQSIRAGKSVLNSVNLAVVPAVCIIAFVLVSLIADQMPCFMGVPNCD